MVFIITDHVQSVLVQVFHSHHQVGRSRSGDGRAVTMTVTITAMVRHYLIAPVMRTVIVMLLWSTLAFADQYGDSLHSVGVDQTRTNEERLDAFHNLGWYFLKKDLDSSMIFAKQETNIGSEIGYPKMVMDGLLLEGVVYWYQDDFSTSLVKYKRVLDLSRKEGEQCMEFAALGNIGNIYIQQGHYKQALQYQLETMAVINRMLADGEPALADALKERMPVLLASIATIYGALGDLENSRKYKLMNLTTSEELLKGATDTLKIKGFTNSYANALHGVGVLYYHKEEYDSAEHYFEHSATLHLQKHKSVNTIAEKYAGIAALIFPLHDFFERTLKRRLIKETDRDA